MNILPKIINVVENDLCIACGACIAACPVGAVTPNYSGYHGAHEIRVLNTTKCANCPKPCDAVCPSIEVDLTKLTISCQSPDEAVGHTRAREQDPVWTGYAPQHRFNGVSSSGGIVRLIVDHLVNQGIPVLALANSAPTDAHFRYRYRPTLVTACADLERLPGSIYHGVSFTDALAILVQTDRPIGLVATPCQMEGIAKYISEFAPELERKIAIAIGLICGWMYSDHAVLAFSQCKGLGDLVQDVGYRGEDKVGNLKITVGGQRAVFDRRIFKGFKEFLDFRACFSSELNRMRCRLCQNHLNLLADIAVGDAWLERIGKGKVSVIVGRTERGRILLAGLADTGRIVLDKGSFDDLIESQSVNLVFSYTAKRLAAHRSAHGLPNPKWYFADDIHSELNSAEVPRHGEFDGEIKRRHLIRKGDYRLFRLAYAVSRWKSVASFLLAHLLALVKIRLR